MKPKTVKKKQSTGTKQEKQSAVGAIANKRSKRELVRTVVATTAAATTVKATGGKAKQTAKVEEEQQQPMVDKVTKRSSSKRQLAAETDVTTTAAAAATSDKKASTTSKKKSKKQQQLIDRSKQNSPSLLAVTAGADATTTTAAVMKRPTKKKKHPVVAKEEQLVNKITKRSTTSKKERPVSRKFVDATAVVKTIGGKASRKKKSQKQQIDNPTDSNHSLSDTSATSTTATATVIRPLDLMKLAEGLYDAKEYHEACEISPIVVEKESDPSLFLQLPNSAYRLAGYWKYRKEWFGHNRAYRSILDLSGNGALTTDDIRIIQKWNFFINIPNDKLNRMVFFWKSFPHSLSEKRCLMYHITAASVETMPLSQKDGIVFILMNPDVIDTNLYKIIDSIMPVKIHSIHVCCLNNEQAYKVVDFPKAKVHIAPTLSDMLPKLHKYGFLKKNLPTEVGGIWKCELLDSHNEQERVIQPSVADTANTTTSAKVGGGCHGTSSSALDSLADAAEQQIIQCEERKKRKREIDAIYARKRRIREKDEEVELKETCIKLSKINKTLKDENEQLEQLFIEVKDKVTLVEYGMSIASSKDDDTSCVRANCRTTTGSRLTSNTTESSGTTTAHSSSSSSSSDESDDDDDDAVISNSSAVKPLVNQPSPSMKSKLLFNEESNTTLVPSSKSNNDNNNQTTSSHVSDESVTQNNSDIMKKTSSETTVDDIIVPNDNNKNEVSILQQNNNNNNNNTQINQLHAYNSSQNQAYSLLSSQQAGLKSTQQQQHGSNVLTTVSPTQNDQSTMVTIPVHLLQSILQMKQQRELQQQQQQQQQQEQQSQLRQQSLHLFLGQQGSSLQSIPQPTENLIVRDANVLPALQRLLNQQQHQVTTTAGRQGQVPIRLTNEHGSQHLVNVQQQNPTLLLPQQVQQTHYTHQQHQQQQLQSITWQQQLGLLQTLAASSPTANNNNNQGQISNFLRTGQNSMGTNFFQSN